MLGNKGGCWTHICMYQQILITELFVSACLLTVSLNVGHEWRHKMCHFVEGSHKRFALQSELQLWPTNFFNGAPYSSIKQGVEITGRNRTVPPCSVGRGPATRPARRRPTAHACYRRRRQTTACKTILRLLIH